jgi:hypothetical protein
MLRGLKGGVKRWCSSQVSQMMARRENTKAILGFLESTEVGRIGVQGCLGEATVEREDYYGWREGENENDEQEIEGAEEAPD